MLLTLLGVALLAAITTGVLALFQAPQAFAPALAILRGAIQLAAISLILGQVIRSALLVAVALLVMFSVATVTATRRLGWTWAHLGVVAGGMGLGLGLVLAIVFGTGAVEFSPRYLLAVGGILTGNAMTAATLSGRRFLELVDDGWDQVEAWLSLGATPRQATRETGRRALHAALIPTTDQTKTTGLVTLPGAFVGAVFGGASPLQAGAFQIIVLAGIMAVGSITGAVVITALSGLRVRPVTATAVPAVSAFRRRTTARRSSA